MFKKMMESFKLNMNYFALHFGPREIDVSFESIAYYNMFIAFLLFFSCFLGPSTIIATSCVTAVFYLQRILNYLMMRDSIVFEEMTEEKCDECESNCCCR